MYTYYRIIHARHRKDPLGYGNSAARWNSRGTEIIYCASSISLVHTEWLSIKGPAVLKTDWLLVTIGIGSKPFSVVVNDLPGNWSRRPPVRATRKLGDIWTKEKISLALKIPSARLPSKAFPNEHNLLLNPHHHDFRLKVRGIDIAKLSFNLNEWAG